MNITTPHFGSYRFHSGDVADGNRHSSPTQSATTATAANVAPTTIAPVDAAAGAAKPAFDAEAVAISIVSFVQQRLAKAADNGASQDQLKALLAQARDGVTAGFGQAVNQLKDTGALTDTLSGGISSALQKIDRGFSDLAKQLGLTTEPAVSSTPAVSDSTDAPASDTPSAAPAPDTIVNTQTHTTPAPQTDTLNQLAAAYSTSFSSRQSVDLVVKTADGDTVHLQLAVRDKQSLSASYQANANGQQLSISSSEKSSAGLKISVDGNLNAGEMQALNDLLGKVGNLADSFFGGDVGSALQQVGTLDFSNSELSSFSLNLHSEVTTRAKVAAYAAVQSLADNSSNTNPSSTTSSSSGLADLVSALTSLVPKASLADNPANLLKQLLAAHIGAANQQNNPLLDFANHILNALGADVSSQATASTSDTTTPPTNIPV